MNDYDNHSMTILRRPSKISRKSYSNSPQRTDYNTRDFISRKMLSQNDQFAIILRSSRWRLHLEERKIIVKSWRVNQH